MKLALDILVTSFLLGLVASLMEMLNRNFRLYF